MKPTEEKIQSNTSDLPVYLFKQGNNCEAYLGRLRLPTARLSATHDDLRVASLLQIMFAAVTPVPLPPLEMTSMGSVKWCGGAAVVFHKAALPDLCAATTIPHS